MNSLAFDFSQMSPEQLSFFRARERYIAFGGARGGGKSWAVRHKAVLLARRFPGIRIVIFRRTFPELRRNHIEPLRAMTAGIAKYNTSEKLFRFINGSVIECGFVDTAAALTKWQGQEIDVIFFDEATNFPEEWLTTLNVCVRGTNNFPKRTYYTCNPGGVGHQYIKRLFIDRNFKTTENPDNYIFIKALVTSNKALMETMPEYVDYLRELPEKRRAAWLDGRWDVFEGQFFEEFRDDPEHYGDRRYTHVIKPFKIPKAWPVYRSYDFGYGKPFSVGWWTVDYDGVIYRIKELYGCTNNPNEGVKWTPERQFDEIARIEAEDPTLRGRHITGVADPSIWDSSRGKSVEEVASEHKIFFDKGDNKRIPGWMQCHYRLQFDANGYPKMYVFDTCKAFIRTIPLLQYSKNHPEDLDTDGEDHVADEFRYFAMSRPVRADLEEVYAKPIDDVYYALDIKPEELRR